MTYRNIHNNPAKSIIARKKISESRKGKSTGSGKTHWNWQGKKDIIFYCLDCGKKLNSVAWGDRSPKYCYNCVNKGKRSPHWKGGTTPQRQKEYKTTIYSLFVNIVLRRDNYTCRECKQYGGKLNVHHIKSYAEYPKLRFDTRNGITLCKDCHDNTKRNKKRPKRIDKIHPKKICQKCGKEFQIRNSHKFCPECMILKCIQCKIKFKVRNGKYNQKFCSRDCYNKWMSINNRGDNNSNWKGGISYREKENT